MQECLRLLGYREYCSATLAPLLYRLSPRSRAVYRYFRQGTSCLLATAPTHHMPFAKSPITVPFEHESVTAFGAIATIWPLNMLAVPTERPKTERITSAKSQRF